MYFDHIHLLSPSSFYSPPYFCPPTLCLSWFLFCFLHQGQFVLPQIFLNMQPFSRTCLIYQWLHCQRKLTFPPLAAKNCQQLLSQGGIWSGLDLHSFCVCCHNHFEFIYVAAWLYYFIQISVLFKFFMIWLFTII